MMKAALSYYRELKTTDSSPVLVNSSTAGSLIVRRRRAKQCGPLADLTPAEQSFLRLINSGQIGAQIARHAPAVNR